MVFAVFPQLGAELEVVGPPAMAEGGVISELDGLFFQNASLDMFQLPLVEQPQSPRTVSKISVRPAKYIRMICPLETDWRRIQRAVNLRVDCHRRDPFP